MYAVNTSRGAGEPAGFRSIQPEWDLGSGETFTVDTLPPEDYVLAEDLVSFRPKTPSEEADDANTVLIQTSNAYMNISTNALITALIDNGTIVLADLPLPFQEIYTEQQTASAELLAYAQDYADTL